MYGVDKYGKRVEITVRSSLVGRSFHSITIECVEDLKILPRIQWRLLWRHNQQKSNKSVIFNIPALFLLLVRVLFSRSILTKLNLL